MGAKKVPDRLRAISTVAVDGTGEVATDRVDIGEMLACQSIAFKNATGARGKVEVFLKQGAVETFICDDAAPASNEWYWYPYIQHLKEGEQVIAKQASCIASDILHLHIIGYKTYDSQGDVL